MAPVFVSKLTPVLPDVETEVLAKFSVAEDVPTLMPILVEPVTVVEPLVKPPATPVRLIPVVALVAEEMLAKVADPVPLI